MPNVHPLVVGFLVALGVGLLVGIDRERNKGKGATRQAAGLRTFTLAALAGADAMAVGDEIVLAAVALGMVALRRPLLLAGARQRSRAHHRDGAGADDAAGRACHQQPEFAAGLGVVVAVLLAARSALHRFVRAVLTDRSSAAC